MQNDIPPNTPPLRERLRQPPSRRQLAYVGALIGAVGLVLLGGKIHKVARAAGEATVPASWALTGIAGDLLFLAFWGLAWFAALHVTRGWRRTLVAAALQASTLVVMVFLVVEHAFFLVTGTQLDWDLLVYTAAHAAKLRKVIASEIDVGSWLAVAAASGVALLPWFWRPKDNSPEAGWRVPTLAAGTLLLALAVVELGFGGRDLPAKLQPLRASPVVTHARDAVRWGTGGDEGDGSGAAGRPVTPLVVVKTERTRPLNVVVLTMESVRARSLSMYTDPIKGAPAKTTPKLAKLMERGTVFESAYTVVPHTTKSLIPIHCGIHPKLTHHFDEASDGSMPTDCLAKVLRRHGWTTHFIQNPESMFERRRDLVGAFGFEKLTADEQLDHKGYKKAGYFGYEDRILVKPTLDWIDAHTKAHPDKPFFLGMLNVTTHHPYTVPKGFPKKDWGVGAKLNKYYDTLSYLDGVLDELFAGFEKRGLLENTVFVMVGDHGEGFGEHGLFQHDQTVYEEGMRVPLLMLGPGVPKGKRRKGLRQHVDIMPTILELLGLSIAAGELPGKDLLKSEGHENLFLSCWKKDSCRAVRKGDLKIIHHFGKRDDEAYDLAADPAEEKDLVAAGKVGEPALEKARAAMEAWAKEVMRHYAHQGEKRRVAYVSRRRPSEIAHPTDITFDGWVKLIGYEVDKSEVVDGEAVWITTHFEVLKTPPKKGAMWMHFLGPWVAGKRKRQMADHVPVEGSYPVGQWKPGEFITDRHWLRIRPGQVVGDWELHLGFWDPDRNARAAPSVGPKHPERPWVTTFRSVHLADLVIRRAGRKVPRARRPVGPLAKLDKRDKAKVWLADSSRRVPDVGGPSATWGDLVRLRGVEQPSGGVPAGESAPWTFHLELLGDVPRWTDVFLHVTGPGDKGKMHRNLKVDPFGDKLPIWRWKKGWRVAVTRDVGAKRKWPTGTYLVWLGFWDPNLRTAVHRLPAKTSQPTRKDAVLVGRFEVVAPRAELPAAPTPTSDERGGKAD